MRADPKPDVIVWPETAYPSTFRKPMVAVELERDQMVERWVRTHRVPIWFGAYDRTETYDYNSLFFLSPPDTDEHDLQTYHKTILLPFGEYIPIVGDIKWIRDRFPQVGFFGKGPGPTAYPVQVGEGERLRVHPIICYEALYPEFTRKGAQAGADLILNITNDSWFGTFGEPQMHFALAKFRSIETGLPQLRATNTGITALVLPDGSLENVGEIGKPQILHYTVPLQNRPTFFLRIGDLLGWLCVFGPLAVLLGRGIRVTRSPRSRG
jgi:apolipoprotein N-acyltransferase